MSFCFSSNIHISSPPLCLLNISFYCMSHLFSLPISLISPYIYFRSYYLILFLYPPSLFLLISVSPMSYPSLSSHLSHHISTFPLMSHQLLCIPLSLSILFHQNFLQFRSSYLLDVSSPFIISPYLFILHLLSLFFSHLLPFLSTLTVHPPVSSLSSAHLVLLISSHLPYLILYLSFTLFPHLYSSSHRFLISSPLISYFISSSPLTSFLASPPKYLHLI